MTTTRFLFILFALLNVLLFAAARGWLDFASSEESAKNSAELNPERIKIIGPTPPPEIPQANIQPPPPLPPQNAPEQPVCLAWSGLSAAQNTKLISLFSKAGIQAIARDIQVPASWRVRVPQTLPTREAAEILVDNMIVESGMEQNSVQIEENGDRKFSVIIGKSYRNRKDAERFLETMKAKRVDASIEARNTSEHRVEATVTPKKAETLLNGQAFAKRHKPCVS